MSSVRWLLAIVVAASAILLYSFNTFERLELLTLDYRFIFKQPKLIDQRIVFIDMAEDSIEKIGRWPWSRKWHATLVKALSDYHARSIAFDVLFSEPQDEMDDLIFEEAIREAGNVYLPVSYILKEQDAGDLNKPGGILSVIEPLERFRKHLKGTGHLDAIPDPDGVLRRVPPAITYNGATAYQFGLKIGLDELGLERTDISFDPKRHEISLRKGSRIKRIPLDSNNQIIINWQNKWGKEAAHYSYVDVIRSYAALKEGKKPLIDLNIFKNKICIIGLTAAGLTDIKPVPIEKAYPAVGINATLANSILHGDFIYESSRLLNIFLIIFLSFLITFCLANIRLLGGVLLAIISMLGYAVFSVSLFSFFNIVILTFYPLLAIFLSYSLTSIYTQVVHAVERTRLFNQATRDELTSLYNIRHFNLLLESEFRNASAYRSRRLAIIMADIDHFKHVNDTYGHPAGDIILKETAKLIKSKCRQTDVAARYGGEEFIVMLPGAGEKEAFDIAEKIRSAVAERKFKFKDELYHTTISLGVSQFDGDKDKSALIEKADKALYQAKNGGRNKTCAFQ